MTLLIIAVILFFIISLVISAEILLLTKKLFKITAPNYKNSIKIIILFYLTIFVANLILDFLKINSVAIMVSTLVAFFVFHYLLKKYYSVRWTKSLSVYLVYNLLIIIISLIVIIPIRLYIMEPFFVTDDAMSPTYVANEYLLVKKINQTLNRSDVIATYHPTKDLILIKRIVGLPGEKITIKQGEVLINDKKLLEPYIIGNTFGDLSVILKNDEYFILGDNRNKSLDSRMFGPITKDKIIGTVFYHLSF